jgi:uncharacterized repeat protein (TIGR03833 family)
MPVTQRTDLNPGMKVQIVEKQHQRTGFITEGVIMRILTKSSTHPHGIKVLLSDGRVGRVQAVLSAVP